MGKKVTLKPNKPGQKKIAFQPGGLHESTGTATDKKIPASKHKAARSGKLGPKARKQELFLENVLVGKKPKKKGK